MEGYGTFFQIPYICAKIAVSVPVARRAGVEPAIIIMASLFTVEVAVSELVSSHF